MSELRIDTRSSVLASVARNASSSSGKSSSILGLINSRLSALSSKASSRFVAANRDLLYVIDQSSVAKKELEGKKINSRDDLVEVIANAVNDTLENSGGKSLDVKKLKASPELASAILLNVGGLGTAIANDHSVGETLLDNGVTNISADYKTQIAEKAASLFDKNSSLNDVSFFKSHTRAAMYLLNNASAVSTLNNSSTPDVDAANFKENVDNLGNQAIYDNDMIEFAKAKTNSGVYDTAFFTLYKDAAEFVAAGEYTSSSKGPKASQVLKAHAEWATSNNTIPIYNNGYSASNVVAKVSAAQAKNVLDAGSPISESFLTEHAGLSRLINNNQYIQANFKSSSANWPMSIILKKNSDQAPVSFSTLETVTKSYQSGVNKIPGLSITA